MALVAPRFLEALDVAPALGRNFTRDEFHFGGPDAVIISHHLWQRRFAADPAILTKKLHFGRYSYSIIGVMPRRRSPFPAATSTSGRQARPMRPSPSAATPPGSPSSDA